MRVHNGGNVGPEGVSITAGSNFDTPGPKAKGLWESYPYLFMGQCPCVIVGPVRSRFGFDQSGLPRTAGLLNETGPQRHHRVADAPGISNSELLALLIANFSMSLGAHIVQTSPSN